MEERTFFTDRRDAGERLLERLRHETLVDPLVLAIPRGGVAVGAVIARGLGCELDIVLSRKLRAPHQPELAVGAVTESGEVHLTRELIGWAGVSEAYLEAERNRQLAEIARRRDMFRAIRPQASVAGRSVILVDDGIATGSTMIAAIHTLRAAGAGEIFVAVPVAPPEKLDAIRGLCDTLVCLRAPLDFQAVGQFYERFDEVTDDEVCELLKASLAHHVIP
jgi:predicted phosphoribosyltransferase